MTTIGVRKLTELLNHDRTDVDQAGDAGAELLGRFGIDARTWDWLCSMS